MSASDQMIVDNRYPGEFDNDKAMFSKQSNTQDELLNNDDGAGVLGRRVYLESPSFDNKEEEEMYRYVSSRLTDRPASAVATHSQSGPALMDSLDHELNLLGTQNGHSQLRFRNETTSATKLPDQQPSLLTTIPRPDPRQDPLLGPLLAELDAMSNQQRPQPSSSVYRRNSLSYQSNVIRPPGSSQTNHVLTNIPNRTVTDALFRAELHDSLEPKDHHHQQQQINLYSNTNSNLPQSYSLSQQPTLHPTGMDNTDLFIPSSYPSNSSTFLNYFNQEDQLFQRPLLNSLGQSYVPSLRPPPSQQQHDTSFEQPRNHLSPSQRTSYARPPLPSSVVHSQPLPAYHIPSYQQTTNPFNDFQRNPQQQQPDEPSSYQMNASNNQEVFFTDSRDELLEQQQQQQQPSLVTNRSNDQQEQDSKRQAIWSELQRTSAQAQERKAKKREPPNRTRAAFGSTSTLNSFGSQQQTPQFRSPLRTHHQSPPMSKPGHYDESADMMRNKENFYQQRSPVRKYESPHLERKEQVYHESPKYEYEHKMPSPLTTKPSRQPSLPITVHVNTNENPRNGASPTTVLVPVESRVNRDGDKISVNIDLRLTDVQNSKQQQQQTDHPNWLHLDPLDRHIRKLERSIDQSLPPTNPPQRSPIMPSTGVTQAMNRSGKTTSTNRIGYSPPVYGSDYTFSDRGRDEETYLSKLNQARKNAQFKPYTGRDYEQFKRNYGFGSGHLGSEFENMTHREKLDQLNRTKQYAQQIETRNRKKIAESSYRTPPDPRVRTETYKPSRFTAYSPTTLASRKYSRVSSHSSPATLNEPLPVISARRPTDVLYRPLASRWHLVTNHQYNDSESIQQFNAQEEEEELKNIQRKTSVSPSRKQHHPTIESDIQRIITMEKSKKALTNTRPTSLPKRLSPLRSNNTDPKRRPIRFDLPSETVFQQNASNQDQQQQSSNVDQQPENQRQTDNNVIHQE